MELEKEDKERQDYEEEYMTRLVLSKKDKHRRRRALEGRDGGVDNLRSNGMHDLEDYAALDQLIQSAQNGESGHQQEDDGEWIHVLVGLSTHKFD
jgi:hypothetical protein